MTLTLTLTLALTTDRRGLAFAHLTAGAIALDGGKPADAMAELVPGLQLAQELGETQLGTRFLSQLAAAHTARHQLTRTLTLALTLTLTLTLTQP